MSDKVLHENDDTLIETVGDVVAVAGFGTAAASYLFHEGYARDFNNGLIRAKFRTNSVLELLDDKISDVTQLKRHDFSDAIKKADLAYSAVEDIGTAYDFNRASELVQIGEWLQNDEEKFLKSRYKSDLQKIVGNIAEATFGPDDTILKEFTYNHISMIAGTELDAENVLRIAEKEMLPGDFNRFELALDEMLFQTGEFRRNNDYMDAANPWYQQNHNAWSQYRASQGDFTRIYKEQQERKNSLAGRIGNKIKGLQGITIKEASELEKNNPEEYRQIRRMFSKVRLHTPDNDGKYVPENYLDELLEQYREYTRQTIYSDQLKTDFGKIELTGIYKGKNGKYFNLADSSKFRNDFVRFVGGFMPFSMGHLGEMVYNSENEPSTYVWKAGSRDPWLARELGLSGDILDRDVYRLGKTILTEDDQGNIVERKDLYGKLTQNSSFIGVGKKEFRGAGFGAEKDFSRSTGELFSNIQESLGLDISERVMTAEKGSNVHVFGKFDQEAADYYIDAVKQLEKIVTNSAVHGEEGYLALGTISRFSNYTEFIKNHTEKLSKNTVTELMKALPETGNSVFSRFYLELINMLYEDPSNVEQVIGILSDGDVFPNYYFADLNKTVRTFSKTPNSEIRKLLTSKDLYKVAEEGAYSIVSFADSLQKQLSQEFFLSLKRDNKLSMSQVFSLINSSVDNETGRTRAKDLAAATEFFDRLDFNEFFDESHPEGRELTAFEKMMQTVRENGESAAGYQQLVKSSDVDSQALMAQLKNLGDSYSSEELGQDIRGKIIKRGAEWQSRRANIGININPLEIIGNINRKEYEKAAENIMRPLADFGRQFFAGPGDLEYFTGLSKPMFNMMSRVNEILNEADDFEFTGIKPGELLGINFKLGLKPEDASTSWKILKNLTMKRVLPVYGAFMALDFVDDVAKGTLGMGVYEAGASGLTNGYLGLKKLTGFAGLDEGLKSLTRDNVLLRYLSGDGKAEWNSYEEEKHYQQKGYSAIRKGRFWVFGSSNAFRGSSISYWEPNTNRMLASDYRDESLYNGSFFTEWSPERLINPYYMENLHKEDRPYPISGSLMDDNTPYGIAINATIGEIIKPRIELHSDRLKDGVDVKTIIAHVNGQIHKKAENNIMYLQSGRMRAMDFLAYDNSPENVEARLEAEDKTGEKAKEPVYGTPTVDGIYVGAAEFDRNRSDAVVSNLEKATAGDGLTFSVSDKIAVSAAAGNVFAKVATFASPSPRNSIASINNGIRAEALDKTQGFMREDKLGNYGEQIEKMYNSPDEIADLLNDSHSDYVQQMEVSARMIGGMYGYIGSAVTGWGQNNQKHLASSSDMTSTSRYFWDQNWGGIGGNTMEAVRRTIPEYRRSSTVNPLMNTMPEWLPERMRYGDPYTLLPNGEARLPGRGYIALNGLHPDQFGDYGAFDRFKILADVAPTSAEYKLWKRIASKTVQDPELKAEMAEIKERVAMQTKQHDFYDYKFVGRGVERKEAYISEIGKNGQFKVVGSDETYKMAGITLKANENETMEQVLGRYVRPGMKVQLVTDENEYYGRNRDKANSINASIVVDGMNISRQMLDNGDARRRKNDNSVAFVQSDHGVLVNKLNWITEAVTHANIPILHSRWMDINSPLESYLDDNLYGTSYQDWANMVDSYLVPNMRSYASSTFWMGYGIASDIFRNNVEAGMGGSRELMKFYEKVTRGTELEIKNIGGATTAAERSVNSLRGIAKTLNKFDRGSLMGSLIGESLRLGAPEQAKFKYKYARRMGNAAALIYAASEAPENLAVSVMSWSRLGYLASDLHMGGKNKWQLAAAGAAVGVLRWAGSKQLLASDETADTYIPDTARKRWDMEDYFDRLAYIKYQVLYNKAADKALNEEGVDIRKILELQDKEAHQIKQNKREIKDAMKSLENRQDIEAVRMRENLAERLKTLKASPVPVLNAGRYTKSAVMYYNTSKATMYALDETSSMTDIIRALPKTEREYFMEFVKEKDPDKRKEILSYTSPQLRKVLNLIWNGKLEKPKSNEAYFADHNLPAPSWSGWNPNIDLADVKAKVIKNEASLLPSDFGIYSSQYRSESVINAPNIEYAVGGDGFILSALNVRSILSGYGLTGVEVSVEPKEDSTLEVIANISRIVPYKIGEAIASII